MSGESNVPSASGDYHLTLTREVAERLRLTMKEFLLETESRVAVLIERSGAVIVSEQNVNAGGRAPRADSLGALAAGLFGSTQVLAAQLGEAEAPEVICHGKGLHIFLSPIDEDFALLAVFPNRVAVGLVRLQAKKAAALVLQDLKEMRRNPTTYEPVSGPKKGMEGEAAVNPFLRFN